MNAFKKIMCFLKFTDFHKNVGDSCQSDQIACIQLKRFLKAIMSLLQILRFKIPVS